MPKTQISKIQYLPITKIFESESDFSDWLSNNIEFLSEKLQIELDNLHREYPVGRFSADLVGREVNTNKLVVIENQFGKTNHDHFGKILTYASGIDAKLIIWIAEEFAEEHKQALIWINNQSNEDIGFFGIEVRAVRIENSPYAVDFEIVVAPNQWAKLTRSRQVASTSVKGEAYREFWEKLLEMYGKKLTPQPQNWMSFGAGKSGVTYGWVFTNNNKFAVELYINTGNPEKNKLIFDHLERNKEKINEELRAEECEIYWGPAKWSTQGAYRIAIYKSISGNILQIDEIEKEKLLRWGSETMKNFASTLSKYLKDI